MRQPLNARSIFWSLSSLSVLLGASTSAAHDFTESFHACCQVQWRTCDLGQPNLPDECRHAHQTVDFLDSCDTLCCIGHALIFDPCPGLIGNNGLGPCTPVLPANQCIDSDGDGLLDDWEINGVDTDGDGTIDVPLPSFGANPLHKDLFLELDVMTGQAPTRAGIQAMKAAFAAAPIDAGGVSNPDGLPGIKLWVDTGALSDSTAAEDGGPAGSCGDGRDNGGDGSADAADPDCLLGDNLGGGNALAVSNICNLDTSFYNSKAANFNANRAQVFRYGVSARGCDADADGNIDSGGWGEIGGNDFVEFNHDGGTIMHELGHTLNLQHGGNNGQNCKPNYVSVMNYDNQFGISQRGGGAIIDYSPPRFAGGRGNAPLASLTENNLDENALLDTSDATNRFVYVNANGNKVQAQLNGNPNYNADVDPPLESGLTVNIDTAATGGGPAACTNNVNNSALTGFDDWSNISISFAQFGKSDTGAINPTTTPEPSLGELLNLQLALNTTDLAITKSTLVSPAIAGAPLTYVLSIDNLGPNPASEIVISDALPPGTQLIDGGGLCSASGSALYCELGELLAGEQSAVNVLVAVDPALVYNNGGPTSFTNHAQVENTLGPDPNIDDNAFDLTTPVVAAADLGLSGLQLVSGVRSSEHGGKPLPLGSPPRALVDDLVRLEFSSAVSSAGPSSPIDALIVPALSAPPGSFAEPLHDWLAISALAKGEQRSVSERFKAKCNRPGLRTFSAQLKVRPRSSADSDPNPLNDRVATELPIDCIVPVAIDVRQEKDKHQRDALLTVTVLTTRDGEYGLPLEFDAARVDVASVRLGSAQVWDGTGGVSPLRSKLEDAKDHGVRGDGDRDLVLDFKSQRFTGAACVRGEVVDRQHARYRFFGCETSK